MRPFNPERAPVFARNGMACSSQPLAAAIGRDVLKAGRQRRRRRDRDGGHGQCRRADDERARRRLHDSDALERRVLRPQRQRPLGVAPYHRQSSRGRLGLDSAGRRAGRLGPRGSRRLPCPARPLRLDGSCRPRRARGGLCRGGVRGRGENQPDVGMGRFETPALLRRSSPLSAGRDRAGGRRDLPPAGPRQDVARRSAGTAAPPSMAAMSGTGSSTFWGRAAAIWTATISIGSRPNGSSRSAANIAAAAFSSCRPTDRASSP